MSAILLENEIVHYEVLGRGRPVIFLHGWVGSWRYWIPVMQAASGTFRTYAIDLWGFGDTAKVPRLYNLNQQMELIYQFMDKMGMIRIALVGHGLGAVVAAMFATRHPDLVDRVMTIGFPVDGNMINTRLRTSTPAALADWLLTKDPLTEAVRAETPKTDVQAIITSLDELASVDTRGWWNSTSTPCVMVHSLADPLITLPSIDQLDELPENSHAITFEQSGHFPMITEGAMFNRLITDYLSQTTGTNPRELQVKVEWKRRVR
jgi:3-oxoadipate enol-lactonase